MPVRYNKRMDYIFNKEKIRELLTDFYTATGIAVTLYDSSMNRVVKSPVYSSYCTWVQTCKGALCDASDRTHMQKAHETGKPVLYVCHAGIMELTTPIFYQNTLIAYLQIGQFVDEEGAYASRERAGEALRLYGDDGAVLRSYDCLPVVSEEKRGALVRMLGLIVQSFWSDGLIYSNRSMLSVKIERYIVENLQEKISVEDLCETFYLSKNALYRLFRAEFSATVGEYVLQKRMERAKTLLKTDATLNIAQIASQCGFDDYNYFIRAFRKTNGITPRKYRKK